MFELRPKYKKELVVERWGKIIPGRRNGQFKGPQQEWAWMLETNGQVGLWYEKGAEVKHLQGHSYGKESGFYTKYDRKLLEGSEHENDTI